LVIAGSVAGERPSGLTCGLGVLVLPVGSGFSKVLGS
jgi:hypothetical protein